MVVRRPVAEEVATVAESLANEPQQVVLALDVKDLVLGRTATSQSVEHTSTGHPINLKIS